MSHLHGKFVWFEHMSGNVAAARAFYDAQFGWKSDGVPMGAQTYHMIQNGAEGIGGFRAVMPGTSSRWVSYLSVADVDAVARSVSLSGGKVLLPPTDFPPVGRGAGLTDPLGAQFSIWQAAQGDRADVASVAIGDWYWIELWTPDPARALGFYKGVFGYTEDAMDMGPGGTYYVLKKDGVPRAGLAKSANLNAKSMWLPYVRVANCDAAAAKAKGLGANVLSPPLDIPDVGRFAVLCDPTGVAVAIIEGVR